MFSKEWKSNSISEMFIFHTNKNFLMFLATVPFTPPALFHFPIPEKNSSKTFLFLTGVCEHRYSFSFDVIFKELKETGSLSRKRQKEIKISAEMYGINSDT